MKKSYDLTLVGLGFLSVLPVPARIQVDAKKLAESTTFFPICGLVLGVFVAGANLLFSLFLPSSLADTLTLLSLFLLTGGLHTDGLADTFDGFLSGKGQEGVRNIMKDSHIGVHGSVVLFFLILIKYLSLQAIVPEKKAMAIVLMVMAGRWSVLLVGYLSRRAASGAGGLGSLFTANITKVQLVKASLLFIPLSFLAGGFSGGTVAFLLAALVSVVMIRIAVSRAGRVSGDTFGAVIEISEAAVIMSATVSFHLF